MGSRSRTARRLKTACVPLGERPGQVPPFAPRHRFRKGLFAHSGNVKEGKGQDMTQGTYSLPL
jgi:hypothetical protein